MFVPKWAMVAVIAYIAVSLVSFYVWLPSEDDCARAIALKADHAATQPGPARGPIWDNYLDTEAKCAEWQHRQ